MGAIVIRDGQVTERAAVGLRSADGGPGVTTADQWHMGSITKSMTATLAALLVEDGLIDWDTTPLEVWPELASEIHPDFRNATLRQFLSHTSGLKRDDDWSGSADSASGTLPQKRHEWAARLLSRSAEFSNGTWSYSNVGLRGRRRHAGDARQRRLGDVAHHAGVHAAGHDSQRLWCAGNPRRAAISRWAIEARRADSSPSSRDAGADNPQAMGPAGTVHTTMDDFVRYLQAHLDGARGIPGLLTVESYANLHAPVASGYALGWTVARRPGTSRGRRPHPQRIEPAMVRGHLVLAAEELRLAHRGEWRR